MGQVQVDYEIRGQGDGRKEITLLFRDQGRSYNPFAREDPDLTLPIEERPVGGLGVYMVKQFMDHTAYQRHEGWNVVRVQKSFST